MCFLCGTDKPIGFSGVLNKSQDDGKMTDPTSRQRGRPKKDKQQISENNLRTESNIWSQVPE
jgi:hypothetical protein